MKKQNYGCNLKKKMKKTAQKYHIYTREYTPVTRRASFIPIYMPRAIKCDKYLSINK